MPVGFAVNVDIAVAEVLFVFALLKLPTLKFAQQEITDDNITVACFGFERLKKIATLDSISYLLMEIDSFVCEVNILPRQTYYFAEACACVIQ